MKRLTKKENLFFNFVGFVLILLSSIYVFEMVIKPGNWYKLLWYCSVAIFLTIFGFFRKDTKILGAVLFGSIAAQFMWIGDFFGFLMGNGLERAYFPAEIGWILFIIISASHLLLIPLTFYGVYKLGFSKKSYLYALFIFVFLMLPLSYLEGNLLHNINCVFYPCELSYSVIAPLTMLVKGYGTFYYFMNSLLFWTVMTILPYFAVLEIFKKLKRVVD